MCWLLHKFRDAIQTDPDISQIFPQYHNSLFTNKFHQLPLELSKTVEPRLLSLAYV